MIFLIIQHASTNISPNLSNITVGFFSIFIVQTFIMRKTFTRIRLLTLFTIACFAASAQSGFWKDVSETSLHINQDVRKIVPKKYRTLELDTLGVKAFMETAPQEFTPDAKNHPLILSLPMPDGSYSRFSIVKYDMMQPGLAAMFPYFKSYSGQGIDDPYATIKIDWNALGFHAQILSAVKGAVYIDPYAPGSLMNYISYNKNDLAPKPFFEDGQLLNTGDKLSTPNRTQAGQCVGPTLRKYRLAVACTGEYARAIGFGTAVTLPQALAAIQTTVNRVNGVYETEVAIRLVLIDSNYKLVFINPTTDPFAGNNNANTLINESQTQITNRIGSSNFDIGHTVSTGGGGLAGLGVVCTNSQKASGITGSPTPTGDGYDIDYVAHEIGHQFGGNHTFNAATGSCSGNGSSIANSEPGSGVTIQAYAGICTSVNDLEPHSIPYFNAISSNEITTYSINSSGNSCAVQISTGNNPPAIIAGSNYSIPINTPFELTGSGSDPDNDPLTYCWEQINVGGPFGDWNTPSGDAPIFRTFTPVTSPTRYFPQLSDQINGTTTIGEILPSYARIMKFRLTGRDNRAGSGGICFSEMTVSTIAGTGPFVVTEPNTTVSWEVSTFQKVKWNVAKTDLTPIGAANVIIELSTDGGNTFTEVLAASTPNDGEEEITVPNSITTTARVRVKAIDNVFYDMSNVDFSIVASTQSGFVLNNPTVPNSCTGTNMVANLNSAGLSGFSTPITLSATGNPGPNSVVFGTNPLTPGAATTVTLSGTVAPGAYTVTVTGTAGTIVKTTNIIFTVGTPAVAATLTLPANLTTGVTQKPTFTWQAAAGAVSYNLEVADNAAFNPLTISANVSGITYTPTTLLAQDAEYYWRLTGVNNCGGGVVAAPYRFKTAQVTCAANIPSTDVPKTISATGTPTVNSTLNIPTGGVISDVNVLTVQGTHSYVSDLTVSLVSPLGTEVTLFSGVCGSNANFKLSFDDQAPSATIPCPPTSGATRQPAQPLAAFNGEDKAGVWTLKVADGFNQDGGSLTGWGLTFCVGQPTPFPVKWLTFTGKKNENNTVLLQWSTVSEINNDHFEIERSSNGIEYNLIGKMNAATGGGEQQYLYNDNKPVFGVNYYRLKQVDKDGKFTYSKIVKVIVSKSGVQYLVYPNPTVDKSIVRMLTDMNNVTLRLNDALGKVIYKKSIAVVKAGEEIEIPVKAFGKGVYVLSINTANSSHIEKVMVQ